MATNQLALNRLPRILDLEDGPVLTRSNLINIIDGAAVWTWNSDSGGSGMSYAVRFNKPEEGGGVSRALCFTSFGGPVPKADAKEIAELFMPDTAKKAMMIGIVAPGAPCLVMVTEAQEYGRLPCPN